jgi:hypothetical protein
MRRRLIEGEWQSLLIAVTPQQRIRTDTIRRSVRPPGGFHGDEPGESHDVDGIVTPQSYHRSSMSTFRRAGGRGRDLNTDWPVQFGR